MEPVQKGTVKQLATAVISALWPPQIGNSVKCFYSHALHDAFSVAMD